MSDLVTERSGDGKVVRVDFSRVGRQERLPEDAPFWKKLGLPDSCEYGVYDIPPIYIFGDTLRLIFSLPKPVVENDRINTIPENFSLDINATTFSTETISNEDGSTTYIVILNPGGKNEFYIGVDKPPESPDYSISVYSVDDSVSIEDDMYVLLGETKVAGQRFTDSPVWFQQLVGSMNQALQ
jgi:hypothetical protein